MIHYVCGYCGIILECDNLGVGLDEDDECEKNENEQHWAKTEECKCLK